MTLAPDAGLAEAWAPLGQALMDFHRGQTEVCFSVSSSLWEDEETPVVDYYRPLSQPLPQIESRALARCRGHVLDLGAGAGRHALELQQLGLRVTAVELCQQAATIMRERGVREVVCADLYSLEKGEYDTILLLMHGLGVVGTLVGLRRFLRHARSLLTPKGRILCDSADLRAELKEAGLLNAPESGFSNYYGEVSFSLSYSELSGPPYPWLFVDPNTLRQEAARAGMTMKILSRGARGAYLAELGSATR